MMQLDRFLDSVLSRAGSAMQPVPGGYDALLAPATAAALGVPDEVHLHLGPDPGPGEVAAGYGSSFLGAVCTLAQSVARRYRLELECAPPKRERIEREALAACVFRNASARLESIDDAVLRYTIVDFRYAATSDEKSEGLVTVAVSSTGTASPRLAATLGEFLVRHPESRREWRGEASQEESWPIQAALESAVRVARPIVRAETRAFVARMERRMTRDLRRVHEYYGALRDEVKANKRGASRAPEKVEAKLAAIEAEQSHRIQDIQRRYTVTLALEPIAALALRIRGLDVQLRAQRRRATALLRLGWNGVARELDGWICVSCGAPAPSATLCESFHPSCLACSNRCAGCDAARVRSTPRRPGRA
jgi:hypothetical protein